MEAIFFRVREFLYWLASCKPNSNHQKRLALALIILFHQNIGFANCSGIVGVNLGNRFEDKRWNPSKADVREIQAKINKAGYKSIRIPVDFFLHANNDEDLVLFIRQVLHPLIKEMVDEGTIVVLDFHNKEISMGEGDFDKFLRYWKTISAELSDIGENLLFEFINEPNGKLNGPKLNALYAHSIPIIRGISPQRPIIITPGNWSKISGLNSLIPPSDGNLYLGIHYYAPAKFTHQGAPWIREAKGWSHTQWPNIEHGLADIKSDLHDADVWLESHPNFRGVFVTEFGTIKLGDGNSRKRWFSAVINEFLRRGWCSAIWQFDQAFGIYDNKTEAWLFDIRELLIK